MAHQPLLPSGLHPLALGEEPVKFGPQGLEVLQKYAADECARARGVRNKLKLWWQADRAKLRRKVGFIESIIKRADNLWTFQMQGGRRSLGADHFYGQESSEDVGRYTFVVNSFVEFLMELLESDRIWGAEKGGPNPPDLILLLAVEVMGAEFVEALHQMNGKECDDLKTKLQNFINPSGLPYHQQFNFKAGGVELSMEKPGWVLEALRQQRHWGITDQWAEDLPKGNFGFLAAGAETTEPFCNCTDDVIRCILDKRVSRRQSLLFLLPLTQLVWGKPNRSTQDGSANIAWSDEAWSDAEVISFVKNHKSRDLRLDDKIMRVLPCFSLELSELKVAMEAQLSAIATMDIKIWSGFATLVISGSQFVLKHIGDAIDSSDGGFECLMEAQQSSVNGTKIFCSWK